MVLSAVLWFLYLVSYYSTLPLLVAGIAADHKNGASTAHNLAVLADSFHTGADFHGQLPIDSTVS